MTRKPKQRVRRSDFDPPHPLVLKVESLTEELHDSRNANMNLARVNARRADQFRALLQVANLLLAVANNEIIELEKLNRD
jgi:hypothetical protein